MNHPNEKVMRELIEYTAKKAGKQSQATGCFILKGNKIVSKAISSTQKSQDTTAHAEINAMRKLSKSRKNNSLKGYWVYSTQKPCPMCASAIVWSEADGVVYGWEGKKGWVDVYFKSLNLSNVVINSSRLKKVKMIGPFLESECLKIKGYKK
ncbi:nucleoside deaminase [Candidatus Woesearchaeota archaeon]|nr:nucleoside deaminase [Candidatus Woesearchaeota archaeon]